MTYVPSVPVGGYAGWRFLQRTMDMQKAAFETSAPVQRATDAFRDRIGSVTSAADLVDDRQLLEVALGAFGLDDDIDNKYFIRRILEDGSLKEDALANRLADKRYLQFTQAFGFGDIGGAGHTIRSNFADGIISRFEDRQFQLAVGQQNPDMRLALNFGPELSDIVERTKSSDARWFSIMGSPPLRQVAEAALGLPSGLARIDLDQQLEAFKDKSRKTFGSEDPADLLAPDAMEKLVRLFLIRSEAAAIGGQTGAAVALSLLQAIPPAPR